MTDEKFWKNYFLVYDTLNKLLPYQELMHEFVSRLGNINGMKIMDAGAGTCNLAILLHEKGAQVFTYHP